MLDINDLVYQTFAYLNIPWNRCFIVNFWLQYIVCCGRLYGKLVITDKRWGIPRSIYGPRYVCMAINIHVPVNVGRPVRIYNVLVLTVLQDTSAHW